MMIVVSSIPLAELEEHTREQKKARLYQEWSDNVFDKIQVLAFPPSLPPSAFPLS